MTKPIHRIVVIFSLFLIINFSVHAKNELSFEQELSINAGDIKIFDVDVGSGSLIIRGENVSDIIVEATIQSKEYSSLDDLQDAFNKKVVFTLDRSGSKATLKALNKNKIFNINNPNIQVNLNITVPKNLDLVVDDGSGSMKIANINGDLDIDDGSGSMQIKNIVGDIVLDDGSGSLEIKNIEGNVVVDDGSGSVNMKNISGNVTIDDGSGSINVEELAGEFKLIDGGSGSVKVNGKKWIEKD